MVRPFFVLQRKAMGRPRTELTAEHIANIERLASFGLTQAQIADCLPISDKTLQRRLNDPDDTEISSAYARGRAKDAEELSNRHRDIAMGKIGAPVSEQRKALEWRLERQHKMPALAEHTHKVSEVRRTVVTPETNPTNRIAAHTNGASANGHP